MRIEMPFIATMYPARTHARTLARTHALDLELELERGDMMADVVVADGTGCVRDEIEPRVGA